MGSCYALPLLRLEAWEPEWCSLVVTWDWRSAGHASSWDCHHHHLPRCRNVECLINQPSKSKQCKPSEGLVARKRKVSQDELHVSWMKQNCCNRKRYRERHSRESMKLTYTYTYLHTFLWSQISHSFLLNNSGHERKKKIIIIKAKKWGPGGKETKKESIQ